MSNSNIDKDFAYIINGIIIQTITQSGRSAVVSTGEIIDSALPELKQAIQQELLKARISELNKHIAWADENVGGITLSRQQLDDRIADLQAKLKGDDK